jgi:hypothetical protein
LATPGDGPVYTSGYAPRPQIRFDVIGEAWRLFQAQMSTWIMAELIFIVGIAVAYVVAFVLFIATAAAIGAIAKAIPFAPVALLLTFFIPIILIVTTMQVLFAGLYNMALKQLRGETIAVGDMFAMTDRLGPVILGSLLYGLAVSVGAIFCYLPGLILGALLMFTIPLIVDRRMDPIEAMKLSFETLKGDVVMATLFFLVCMFVGQIGGIACGIGALFTYPLFFLSIALAYRDFFLPTTGGTVGGYGSSAPVPSVPEPTMPAASTAPQTPAASSAPPDPSAVEEVSPSASENSAPPATTIDDMGTAEPVQPEDDTKA